MRRVLFICPNLARGGAERQWAMLIPRLAERGFEPRVLALDGEGSCFDELRQAGVAAECAQMRSRGDLPGLRRAFSLAGPRPDLVITRGVSAQIVGQLLAWKLRVPHLVSAHFGSPALLRTGQRRAIRLTAPYTTRVVAVTSAQIQTLAKLGYRRISVIPNAVDPCVPGRSRAAIRRELGVGGDEWLAVLVANLRPEKRIEDFVRAVVRARRADPRIRGLVAGAGSELEFLRGQTERTEGAVRLLGHRRDVPDVIHAADAVCLSSGVEAQPTVLLEAMALSRPVVATCVGGVADLVVHGKTGLLVPPRDVARISEALEQLARDPELGERLGRQGFARQRELFDVERMTDAYAALLDAVVTEARAPSLTPTCPAAEVSS